MSLHRIHIIGRGHHIVKYPYYAFALQMINCGVTPVWAGDSSPGVVTYEGTKFPEQDGWERVGTYDADREISDGMLVVGVDVGVWLPLPRGEQDFYRRTIPEFDGIPFFLEWGCFTDAPNTEVPWGGGITVNIPGLSVINHFLITGDLLQVWRGNSVPLSFYGIAPNVAHTYRQEFSGNLYTYYVDGTLIQSGTLLGPFPNADARLIWGSTMYLVENSSKWDYLRYGMIPTDGSGDFDSNGVVTLDDFYFVHECLTNDRPGIKSGLGNDAGPGCRFADLDADGDADLLDFADFQTAFTPGE